MSADQSCTICGQSVSTKRFQRHMKSHRYDLPFSCYYCEQKFKTNTDLRQHTTEKHNVTTAIALSRQFIPTAADSISFLRDQESCICWETIARYLQEVVLAHKPTETLIVDYENFGLTYCPTAWPPAAGNVNLTTYPAYVPDWKYALIPMCDDTHWFIAIAFRDRDHDNDNIVVVYDTKNHANHLNKFRHRLRMIAALLFGNRNIDVVQSTRLLYQNNRWSSGYRVCILADHVMRSDDPKKYTNANDPKNLTTSSTWQKFVHQSIETMQLYCPKLFSTTCSNESREPPIMLPREMHQYNNARSSSAIAARAIDLLYAINLLKQAFYDLSIGGCFIVAPRFRFEFLNDTLRVPSYFRHHNELCDCLFVHPILGIYAIEIKLTNEYDRAQTMSGSKVEKYEKANKLLTQMLESKESSSDEYSLLRHIYMQVIEGGLHSADDIRTPTISGIICFPLFDKTIASDITTDDDQFATAHLCDGKLANVLIIDKSLLVNKSEFGRIWKDKLASTLNHNQFANMENYRTFVSVIANCTLGIRNNSIDRKVSQMARKDLWKFAEETKREKTRVKAMIRLVGLLQGKVTTWELMFILRLLTEGNEQLDESAKIAKIFDSYTNRMQLIDAIITDKVQFDERWVFAYTSLLYQCFYKHASIFNVDACGGNKCSRQMSQDICRLISEKNRTILSPEMWTKTIWSDDDYDIDTFNYVTRLHCAYRIDAAQHDGYMTFLMQRYDELRQTHRNDSTLLDEIGDRIAQVKKLHMPAATEAATTTTTTVGDDLMLTAQDDVRSEEERLLACMQLVTEWGKTLCMSQLSLLTQIIRKLNMLHITDVQNDGDIVCQSYANRLQLISSIAIAAEQNRLLPWLTAYTALVYDCFYPHSSIISDNTDAGRQEICLRICQLIGEKMQTVLADEQVWTNTAVASSSPLDDNRNTILSQFAKLLVAYRIETTVTDLQLLKDRCKHMVMMYGDHGIISETAHQIQQIREKQPPKNVGSRDDELAKVKKVAFANEIESIIKTLNVVSLTHVLLESASDDYNIFFVIVDELVFYKVYIYTEIREKKSGTVCWKLMTESEYKTANAAHTYVNKITQDYQTFEDNTSQDYKTIKVNTGSRKRRKRKTRETRRLGDRTFPQ